MPILTSHSGATSTWSSDSILTTSLGSVPSQCQSWKNLIVHLFHCLAALLCLFLWKTNPLMSTNSLMFYTHNEFNTITLQCYHRCWMYCGRTQSPRKVANLTHFGEAAATLVQMYLRPYWRNTTSPCWFALMNANLRATSTHTMTRYRYLQLPLIEVSAVTTSIETSKDFKIIANKRLIIKPIMNTKNFTCFNLV